MTHTYTPRGHVRTSAGIVIGAAAALIIYHLGNLIARWRKTGADDGGPIPAVGQIGGDFQVE